MNIRDLQYLTAIAEYKHFGKAADACFVSQPALSIQIKKLEDILGVQLIERTKKSVMLTAIGQQITAQAQDILHRVDILKDLAKQAKDPFKGKLHIGIIPTLAPYLLPHIIPGLKKTYPDLTIYLIEEQTAVLIEKLKQGKIDAALLGLPLIEENFQALPLFEEEFLLAVPQTHAFAKQKHIQVEDLKNKNLLLLEDGHCMRDAALELCYRAKADEVKSFQATSLETLRHMVACNAGITLLPRLAYRDNDGIHYLPFRSAQPSRIIGLIWRTTTSKKNLLEHMAVKIRKLMTKQKTVKVINTPIVCQR